MGGRGSEQGTYKWDFTVSICRRVYSRKSHDLLLSRERQCVHLHRRNASGASVCMIKVRASDSLWPTWKDSIRRTCLTFLCTEIHGQHISI